jgi:4-amino-4-deoxy-L-arabinose transferase-like glycosyltransferase
MSLPGGSGRTTGADGSEVGTFWRSERGSLLTILFFAVLMRLASVLVLRGDPRISEPIIDAGYYLDFARRLAQGSGWPAGPIFMSPLYPLLLSLAFRIAGPGVATVQFFQSLLGLGTLVLLFLAVRRDLGRRAAVGAAALFILCGPILAMESMVLMESLQLFLVTAALWAWPGRNRRTVAPLIFGTVCGMLTIGRGVFLLLPVGWFAWMVWCARPARRLAARMAGLVLAALLVTLLPLAAYQSRATGNLQVLALNGGLNLYLGNNPATDGLYSLPDGIDLKNDPSGVHSASVLAGRTLTPVEADRFYAERAQTFLRGQPGRALWLLGRKALLYLTPREVPQIDVFDALRASAWPLRVAFVDFRWLLPLAALGLAGIGTWRSFPAKPGAGADRPSLSPWLVVVAVGWLSTILFFATGRHRLPFLAGFLGPAGVGATDLAGFVVGLTGRGTSRLRGRLWTPELGEAAAQAGHRGPELSRVGPTRFAVLPAVVALQLLFPSYSRNTAFAFDAVHLGDRAAQRGDPAAALRHYREAVRLIPTFGQAWGGEGAALNDLGRLREAADAYRRAVAFLPESPVLHAELGMVYGRLADHAAALAEFREAVRLDPLVADYHFNLGVALRLTGDELAAEREFRRAQELDPSSVAPRQDILGNGPHP